MRHPVGQALLGDCRDRVAPADHDGRAVLGAIGNGPGDRVRPVRERRDLEHAQRPVPEDGPRVGQRLLHQLERLGTHVDDVPRGRDLLGRERLVLRSARDLLGDDHVDREDDPDAAFPGRGEDPLRVVDAVVLGEALADALALGQQERVGHPAAEDEQVDLGEQVVDDGDLVGHLGAAEDGREWALGRLEQLREHLELALHQETGICRQELGDPDGRGMRPVGGPERVVDVDVGIGGERLREFRVVGLLFGVEAQVLEQQDLAGPHALERVLRPERRARRP